MKCTLHVQIPANLMEDLKNRKEVTSVPIVAIVIDALREYLKTHPIEKRSIGFERPKESHSIYDCVSTSRNPRQTDY